MVKLTFEFVQEYIKSQGEVLISTEYINNKKLLEIKCKLCDEIYEQIFDRYKRGFTHRRCSKKVYENKGGQNGGNKRPNQRGICKFCGKEFIKKKSKQFLCDMECSKGWGRTKCGTGHYERIGRIGGLISAKIQVRRSVNEIHFAELCETKFDNVLTNETIFDGWDTDVILPDLKIAISWNGIWHYKQVRNDHNLNQVQSRDKIKDKIVKKYNYIHYIIKDMGGKNRKFVENEFEKFMDYVYQLKIPLRKPPKLVIINN